MRDEHFSRRFVAEALLWLIIQVAGELDEVALWTQRYQVHITRHDAANALVGVFNSALLPRCE